MKRINRRDCLVRMGIGAGAIIGAPRLDALAFEERDHKSPLSARTRSAGIQKSSQVEELNPWLQRSSVLPPLEPRDNIVRLFFFGLMGFSYKLNDKKSICDVGFHASGDDDHHHHLSICAFQKASCERVFANGNQAIKQLSIERETKPSDFSEAYFYQPDNPTTRQDLTDYDFRWIVDFESQYMYRPVLPQGAPRLEPRPRIYRPVLSIPFGLFYTLRHTNSTFRAQNSDGTQRRDLYKVANIMAASIFVDSKSAILLTVNNFQHRVEAPGEIYFINHCYRDSQMSGPCVTQPYNSHYKEKRNDFYLQYKAFKRPAGSDEYELVIAQGVPDSPSIPGNLQCLDHIPECISHSARMDTVGPFSKALTDEAPCAASGYGGGGGLLPNP